jgi:hypothetical protein
VGWSRSASARWGRARGPAETASIHWGLATALVVEAKERERVLAGQQPQAPPLPRCQTENDKEIFFAKIS